MWFILYLSQHILSLFIKGLTKALFKYRVQWENFKAEFEEGLTNLFSE